MSLETVTSSEARKAAPRDPGRVADVVTVFVREMLPALRSPYGLIFGMIQPLVFLALFGPLLTGVDGFANGASASADTWLWYVPAVLMMLALFGTTGTGYELLTEIQTGSHERLMVTPLNRSAMLVGRTLSDTAKLLVQAVLVVLVMLPFGLRPDPLGVVLSLSLLGVLGVGFGSLSHALAIACRRQQESFYMIQSTLLYPLLFLSGLMLPLELGPAWMQTLGRLNPLTYVVDAMRALFSGDVLVWVVAAGFACALAIAVVGIALGADGLRRALS